MYFFYEIDIRYFFIILFRALQSQYDLLKIESKNLNSRLSGHSINSEETRSVDSRTSDREMIAEAQLLRSYKERLENRMCILEDHNDRLSSQLQRLRQLLTGGEGEGGQVILLKAIHMHFLKSVALHGLRDVLRKGFLKTQIGIFS